MNPTSQDPSATSRDEASPAVNDDVFDAALVPAPQTSSPFAFGLKALLALTAIAGVQFALMSYLGPLVGLLVGIGVCITAMTILLISSIILGLQPGSPLMEQMDRIAIRLVVGMVVLFFGSILAGGGQMVYVVVEDARFNWKLQSDLGFTYARRTLFDPDTETVTNALEVTAVTIGGAVDQAGIQKGELILLDGTADDFLITLAEQRGQAMDVAIANYAASSGDSDLDEATLRTVTLHIPE